MSIDKRIEGLGGIELNIDSITSKEVDNTLFKFIERDTILSQFMLKYAPFFFNLSIGFKNNNNDLLNTTEMELLEVGVFYSVYKESNFNIRSRYDLDESDFKNNYLPFCSDGYSGDFFCVGINENNYGKIFYYLHDAVDERFFELSISFEVFFESLIVFDE